MFTLGQLARNILFKLLKLQVKIFQHISTLMVKAKVLLMTYCNMH